VLPAVGSMIVPPGLSSPVALGALDHADADAVLHREARIEQLELHEDVRVVGPGCCAAQHRRVADEIEDVVDGRGLGAVKRRGS
jgi:hypothetical protein